MVLARLHEELLPTSPVVEFGPRFLRDFYYRFLPEGNCIFGVVAYVDDEPAGFIVATDDGATFAQAGIRRHWVSLVLVMIRSVLESPRRLISIGRAVHLLRSRRAEAADRSAEILSMGVLPTFLTPAFLRSSQLRISLDLIGSVMDVLSARGIGEVKVYVDSDNRAARLFYLSQGWQCTGDVTGWSVPVVEFVRRVGGSGADVSSHG
jgi:hypothetical protein